MQGYGRAGQGGPFSASYNVPPLTPHYAVIPSHHRPAVSSSGRLTEPHFTGPPPYGFSVRPPDEKLAQFHSPTTATNFQRANPLHATSVLSRNASSYEHLKPTFFAAQSFSRPQSVSDTYLPQFLPTPVPDRNNLMGSNEGAGSVLKSGIDTLCLEGGLQNGPSDGEMWRRKEMNATGTLACSSSQNADNGSTAILDHLSGIDPLNSESNYLKWKSQIDVLLGHLEYDVALLEPKPDEPKDADPNSVKANYHKWIKANRMCILLIRGSMSDIIGHGVPETDSAKELMNSIHEQFIKSKKHLIGTMISQLCATKFDGQVSVYEHIRKMENLVCRLRGLKMELSEDFLVHVVLNSLPEAYNTFKADYYSTEYKWNLNELIAQCTVEELKIGKENGFSDLKGTLRVRKRSFKKSSQDKQGAEKKNQSKSEGPFQGQCFHCKQYGHTARNCPIRQRTEELRLPHQSPQPPRQPSVPVHFQGECHFCGVYGHMSLRCPRRKDSKAQASVHSYAPAP